MHAPLIASLLLLSPATPDVRLDPGVRPQRYDLRLTVNPAEPTFSGAVDIPVTSDKALSEVVLHARDLNVKKATARVGKSSVALKPSVRGKDLLVLTPAKPLAKGSFTLQLEWEGRTDKAPLQGLYRFQHQGDWYAATQFEATDARRMAPCFDEPAFKVPLHLTLTAPAGLQVVGNGAILKQTVKGNQQVVDFAVTRPLPSYLWAVLVGPFDVVDAGKVGSSPIRVLTPRGSAALGAYAARMAGPVQKFLEDYFGMPLPYGKLDHVVLTEFGSGGMENAGAITYREEAMLVDDTRASVGQKRRILGLMAHEVAHQWFGDLVTMQWWDDLWLNEAFASWMGGKTVDALAPELEGAMDVVTYQRYGMYVDSLPSTHAVHTEVDSAERADEVFDAITYIKGGSVLGMVEQWLGPDVFRTGVRAYLTTHADKNARGDDLFAALATAAAKPEVQRVVEAWFTQKHHPIIAAELLCQPRPAVRLTPRTYALLGPAPAEGVRPTPVCLKYPDGAAQKTTCVLAEGPLDVPLETAACPAWVLPNAGSVGFYKWELPPPAMLALVDAPLAETERAMLLDNAWTLVRVGTLPLPTLAQMLDRMAKDPSRHVAGRTADRWLDWRESLAAPADAAAINKHVADLFRARAVAAGWQQKDGESEAAREERAMLVDLMALDFEDPAFVDEAVVLADRWLADPRSVSPDVARVAVAAAATRLTAEQSAARAEKLNAGNLPPDVRVALIQSLTLTNDPAVLTQNLDRVSAPWLRDQDVYTLLGPAFRNSRSRPVAWAWFRGHWEAVSARLDDDRRMSLPSLMGGACTKEERDSVAAFWAEPAHALRGTGARLNEALTQVDACVDMRTRLGASLSTVVAGWSAPPPAAAPPAKAKAGGATKGGKKK